MMPMYQLQKIGFYEMSDAGGMMSAGKIGCVKPVKLMP